VIESATAVEFFTRMNVFHRRRRSDSAIQFVENRSSRREEVDRFKKRREAMATSPPFFFSNEGSLSEKKQR
jgi:hypothetical protein